MPSGSVGSDQISSVPPQAMPVVGPLLADSFGFAFWVAFALTAVIIVPAILLPRHAARDRDVTPAAPGI